MDVLFFANGVQLEEFLKVLGGKKSESAALNSLMTMDFESVQPVIDQLVASSAPAIMNSLRFNTLLIIVARCGLPPSGSRIDKRHAVCYIVHELLLKLPPIQAKQFVSMIDSTQTLDAMACAIAECNKEVAHANAHANNSLFRDVGMVVEAMSLSTAREGDQHLEVIKAMSRSSVLEHLARGIMTVPGASQEACHSFLNAYASLGWTARFLESDSSNPTHDILTAPCASFAALTLGLRVLCALDGGTAYGLSTDVLSPPGGAAPTVAEEALLALCYSIDVLENKRAARDVLERVGHVIGKELDFTDELRIMHLELSRTLTSDRDAWWQKVVQLVGRADADGGKHPFGEGNVRYYSLWTLVFNNLTSRAFRAGLLPAMTRVLQLACAPGPNRQDAYQRTALIFRGFVDMAKGTRLFSCLPMYGDSDEVAELFSAMGQMLADVDPSKREALEAAAAARHSKVTDVPVAVKAHEAAKEMKEMKEAAALDVAMTAAAAILSHDVSQDEAARVMAKAVEVDKIVEAAAVAMEATAAALEAAVEAKHAADKAVAKALLEAQQVALCRCTIGEVTLNFMRDSVDRLTNSGTTLPPKLLTALACAAFEVLVPLSCYVANQPPEEQKVAAPTLAAWITLAKLEASKCARWQKLATQLDYPVPELDADHVKPFARAAELLVEAYAAE